MKDTRTRAQRCADAVTEFSGSWPFIIWFCILGTVWVVFNLTRIAWDPYPFLFLNIVLTIISTLQSPVIMLSQNRQNETDREYVQNLMDKLNEVLERQKKLEEALLLSGNEVS